MTLRHLPLMNPDSSRPASGADPPLRRVTGALNEDIIGDMDRGPTPIEEHSRVPHRWASESGHSIPAAAPTSAATGSPAIGFKELLRAELAGLHPRLAVARMLLWLLPIHVGGRVRSSVLRMIGFRIGRGTIMAATPTITGDGNMYDKLVIGSDCWINIGCLFDLAAEIRIGSHVR